VIEPWADGDPWLKYLSEQEDTKVGEGVSHTGFPMLLTLAALLFSVCPPFFWNAPAKAPGHTTPPDFLQRHKVFHL
jgi:hypothetical protein